tara:strand:+ start:12800 stop:13882 length:1083 start_codon:yes stop_codon:yes gene_type:complete
LKTNSSHISFQLNGTQFSSSEEMISFTASISKELSAFLKEWFSDEDFILVNTSGSTGKPKPIELRKEHMLNSALATGDFFKLPEKTTALCCLPIAFIAGKMMLIRALTLGWHLDLVQPSSSPLETIDKEYDFTAMVPLQVANSLNKLHLVDALIIGGGVVSQELETAIQKLSTKVFATYGMTETITHIAVRKLNHKADSSSNEFDRSALNYKLLPNVTIDQDDRNCLVINASKVTSEIIVTNDVVEIISENEFIWKGRFDHVINSGGIKLHPEEIEKKLSSKFNTRFFVAGIPDEKLGEKLVLLIEGESTPVISDVVRNLSDRVSKFELPKEIFYVSDFIETDTGKIQRQETLNKALTNL